MDGNAPPVDYVGALRARAESIADACTRCGKCFEACPMTTPAGLAGADPAAVTGGIVDLISGGEGTPEAARWAEVCSGSGNCIPACNYGINPRFMVQLARAFAKRRDGETVARQRGREAFGIMSRSVRTLSRLQLPPEVLARVSQPRYGAGDGRRPEVVFYTGCNILRTPHIALLCLDILDALGIEYEVMGGPGQCCGVLQHREGDFGNSGKVAYATIDGLAAAGTQTVLSWCPSCQIQLGEVSLPNYTLTHGAKPFDLDPFLVFLAERAPALQKHFKHPVHKRVVLHEMPAFPQVVAAVRKLLSLVPGVEVVDIEVPRIGTQTNTLNALPALKREIIQKELRAVADAGVTTLATIYHACHRELCDLGDGRDLEVINFLEILGQSMGLHSEDLYKRLKMMKDIDEVIAETSPLIDAYDLDIDRLRDALHYEFFADHVPRASKLV